MEKKTKIKLPKIYAIILGFFNLTFQTGLYSLGHIISSSLNIKPFYPKIEVIDNLFPQIPFFIIIYYLSYVFWVIGPIVASYTKNRNFSNAIVGISISYLIGFLIFCFAPSYMNRETEGLYASLGTDLFSKILKFNYDLDGKNLAFNLFPSFHCMISTYCYLGVRKQKEIPFGIKISFLITAFLIVLATLFTKQHFILDSIAGITLAIITYAVSNKLNLGKYILPLLIKFQYLFYKDLYSQHATKIKYKQKKNLFYFNEIAQNSLKQ